MDLLWRRKMTKASAVVVMVCFLGMPFTAASSGPDWVLYGRPDSGSLVAYYDRAKVVRMGDGMLRVTVKYVYSEGGKKEVIRSRERSELRTEGYENLGYSMVQYELDCGKGQQSIFSISEMDLNGKELDHYNPSGRIWTPVKPGGIGEALIKEVCK